ncbi:uncharacterized protein LOC133739085 isoform X2 [Rosa rugosa]|uniref:uncharacterized protein LOC133739085 isoform X2 n=1 Tax=Rosa rugosa TaxID=74645 RepID=UPI002B40E172|nr:uncharacterized protein LOC133739085 isoform X2 [Rosa rugosa]
MRRRVKGLVLRAQARIFLAWISSGISFLESKRYSKSAGKKTVEYMVALAEKTKDMSVSAGNYGRKDTSKGLLIHGIMDLMVWYTIISETTICNRLKQRIEHSVSSLSDKAKTTTLEKLEANNKTRS